MESNYQYIDPDFIYTNRNGVLVNIAKIGDEKVLIALKVSRYPNESKT
jgi:hypothetical protein